MAIRKRKLKSGGVSWAYFFDAAGSTREKRVFITKWGFGSKKEAQEAEADRRILERKQAEIGIVVMPKTLGQLLAEFCVLHGDRNLAPKTVARYRDHAKYLAPELLAMPIDAITPLVLTREWNRLKDSGGHTRKTKQARALSAKTVRNIAGFVQSAFHQAVTWELVKTNPVIASTRPKGAAQKAVALSPAQQRLLIDASTHWVLPAILEVAAGLGARRGEVLALRWSDITGDEVRITRSLSQVDDTLVFKTTKSPSGYRMLTIPTDTMAVLADHRAKQMEFRRQFGTSYRLDLDLVFCDPGGSPLRPDSISASASALCRRLKLPPGVSLHALRHTHGSQLLVGGMELPAVSARLGHSSPSVTARIYAHLISGRDRKAAEVWNDMQTPKSGKELKQ